MLVVASRLLPAAPGVAFHFVVLTLRRCWARSSPNCRSDLAALLLRDEVFRQGISECLKYATLAILFVNVSIGGTPTPYAAHPVLMVSVN
jgi:hypothetical protein